MRQNGFDLNAIAAAVDRHTGLSSWQIPTIQPALCYGGRCSRLLGKINHPLVVLDEAYYEFAQDFAASRRVQYSHSLDYVREGRNVVVLRTFSKVHGLAGARIGYGIASAGSDSAIRVSGPCIAFQTSPRQRHWRRWKIYAHIRRAVENNTHQAETTFQEISEIGYRGHSHLGQFSLLSRQARRPGICRTSARRRNFGASAELMGRSQSHSDYHWHTAAERHSVARLKKLKTS